ncbi:MAG: hypothetical protein IPG94_16710 [Kineosporiaceae bacterium]|nr:hypothetical protein [Kineosporiaceae bacterium]
MALTLVSVALVTGCGSSDPSPNGSSSSTGAEPSATPPAESALPTDSPSNAAPSAGGVLFTASGQGRLIETSNNVAGFTFLRSLKEAEQDKSSFATFSQDGSQLAEVTADQGFTGECGIADVASGSDRVIVTEHVVVTPAAGITPERRELDLVGWTATGTKKWTIVVIPAADADRSAAQDCVTSETSPLQDTFSATSDGRFGTLVPSHVGFNPLVIDLATGRSATRPDLRGPVGNTVAAGPENGPFTLLEPLTWKKLGSIPQLEVHSDAGSRTIPSRDGSSVIVTVNPSRDGEALVIASLPSGKVVYHGPNDLVSGAIAGGYLITHRDAMSGKWTSYAVDDRTGKKRWSVPTALNLCLATPTALLVQAGDQIATLDPATGAQRSYATSGDYCRGTFYPSGIKIVDDRVEAVTMP